MFCCPRCKSVILMYEEIPEGNIYFNFDPFAQKVHLDDPSWEIVGAQWKCRSCHYVWDAYIDSQGRPKEESA